MPLHTPADPIRRDAGWKLSVEPGDSLATALEEQLPEVAATTPSIILLPLVTQPDRKWSPWHLFPASLAVLLAAGGRDVVYACNTAAREVMAAQASDASSAEEWLSLAVRVKLPVTILTPHLIPSSPEWQRQLPALAPRCPSRDHNWRLAVIQESPAESLVPSSHEPTSTIALQAGIYQWHDYLEESHAYSQQIEGEGPGQLGDYWHGIMHRREPDVSNAKYWFRRVGKQAIFADVARTANLVLAECHSSEATRWSGKITAGGRWDPFAFIDFCSACESREDELNLAARHIQFLEMGFLLQETWRVASRL